ncbi:MAG: radical SAM protein [Clostridiales bacterium]|nr:radical SAM protein [Clostridiales bacterium]
MDFIEDASAVEKALINRASQSKTPINGSIELLPLCNMNCDMCYVRLSRQEMERLGRLRTVEEWLDVARQMRDAGTLFLLLTGGEPLVYPDFRRLYLALKELGMLIAINTNGTLIDEDWARFFGENKPRRMNITLYGPDEETYANLCHYPGGFEKTLNAIRLLRAQGVEVRVSLSVTRENARHLGRMIDMVKELGAAVLVDTYMQPITRERSLPFNEQSRLVPEAAAHARVFAWSKTREPEQFIRIIQEGLFSAKYLAPEEGPKKMSCLAASCSFTINWQGEMRPCVALSEPSAPVFELGFLEAWKRIREGVDKIILSSRCAQCSLRLLCQNCAAAAISETGAYDGTPEYMCRYAREILRIFVHEAEALQRMQQAREKTGENTEENTAESPDRDAPQA